MSINKIILSGNLTRNPELRAMQNGTSVLQFGMAVNDRVLNKQTNQWEDRPNYVDVTMFGNRADALSKYLTKGSKVCVEGKIRWSSWNDQQGQKRSKIEVICDEIELMTGTQQQNQQMGSYVQPQRPVAPSVVQPAPAVVTPQVVAPQNRNFYQFQPSEAVPEPSLYDEAIPF